MLRTILTIGLFAVLGIVALKLVFGLVIPLLGVFFWLVGVALQIAIVGLVVYVVLRVVSPDTARRLRERFGR
jgi:TRAP-type C4-dicarboxylate transport system permease small subunit